MNTQTAIQSGADGQITAASKRFTSATAVFTSKHVGRSIKISGATNPANNNVFLITAYVDPNNVTLYTGPVYVNESNLTWGLVGTPQPIIERCRGTEIAQASGKTFTVMHPEVAPVSGKQEWNHYGYGPNGYDYAHQNSQAELGTLVETAGIATALDVAATLHDRSSLMHAGGAVILGAAPLVLGGAAAQAWPAAGITDLAAGTPEMCYLKPNVT